MQHPYLTNPMLEPRHLPNKELHQNLIDASSKLRFLTMMLPKLKARGHRVLLFSQVSLCGRQACFLILNSSFRLPVLVRYRVRHY
jgi:hypothetical protein